MGKKGKKGSGKKDPYASLGPTFQETIRGLKEAEIRERISRVALDEEALRKAQTEDQDLQNIKDKLSVAQEPYRRTFKDYRLQIKFMKQVLEEGGKAAGEAKIKPLAEVVVEKFVAGVQKGLKPGESVAFVSPGGNAAIVAGKA